MQITPDSFQRPPSLPVGGRRQGLIGELEVAVSAVDVPCWQGAGILGLDSGYSLGLKGIVVQVMIV